MVQRVGQGRGSDVHIEDSPRPAPRGPDQVVRDVYRAFELRDLGLLGSLLADEVVCLVGSGDGGSTTRGSGDELCGRESVLRWLAELIDASGGSLSARLQRLYAHPSGWVVVFQEVTHTPGRVRSVCLLVEVDAGSVMRVLNLTPAPSGPLRIGPAR